MIFRVIIDSETYCTSLGDFEEENAANNAGKDWELEMTGIDPENANEYSYFIEEIDGECDEECESFEEWSSCWLDGNGRP